MKLLEPVIGLEIHVQLKTKSKMFCGCLNDSVLRSPAKGEEAESPNKNTCPICIGHPGTLPVPNEQAVRFAVLVGLALGCKINTSTKFDRKHYFYPDLPKGYQISQYDVPIAEHGFFDLIVPAGEREQTKIGITRVHLEEDSAKSFHGAEGKTYVDFNRAGTPLVEIVTEPDFRTAREAKTFLQELRLIAKALGVSNADMEKGELRCDVNVSMREIDKAGGVIGALLNPKSEIKNINSFKAVERAIEYEIQRQSKLWQLDSPPAVSSTRGWNDTKQITEDQRTKEAAEDYRYFPEPDIPALELGEIIEQLKPTLPELPAARRRRLVDEYALNSEEARHLTENPELADFSEQTFSELFAWMESLPSPLAPLPEGEGENEWQEKEKHRLSHLACGWLISKLGGILTEKNLSFHEQKITPENFAEFVIMVAQGKLSTRNGLTILNEMVETGADPEQILEDRSLNLVSDESELATVIEKIIAGCPTETARYKNGEKQLLKFFLGQIMKETSGKAEPTATRTILEELLNK
ncbi:MAG: Asp-tRNA(Asn)/Glu-tRNA(Gln) amidotransferase subunit GatB [Candidatus Uhrbacteria bacterium]